MSNLIYLKGVFKIENQDIIIANIDISGDIYK